MKLLLLHPLPLDGSIFSDDIRGLGDACATPTLHNAGDDITSWAEAALDVIGDGPVVVVGNSIGGSCAIEVARIAPTKVTALVLCGSKPGHRPEPAFREEALQVLASDGLAAAWERYCRSSARMRRRRSSSGAGVPHRRKAKSARRGGPCVPRSARPQRLPQPLGRTSVGGERRARHQPRTQPTRREPTAQRDLPSRRSGRSLRSARSAGCAHSNHRSSHRYWSVNRRTIPYVPVSPAMEVDHPYNRR